MKTSLKCLPCLGRNAVDIAERTTGDAVLRKKIVAASLRLLADDPLENPPPFLARKILDLTLALSGNSAPDPYREEKRSSTELAKTLVAELKHAPGYNPESFESRLRLAIAGNILDFSIFTDLDIATAFASMRPALTVPLDVAAVERLQRKMDSARRILYLLDNCGEAVFDREFIAPYREKITLAVRGKAAFNDITRAELADSGLEHYAQCVVDNGNGVPGVNPVGAGPEFLRCFENADLLIAKGQGNFETLSETDRPSAFLFLTKCPVVAQLIGAKLNSIQVLLRNC